MKRNYHPAGDRHWTRRAPDRVLRGTAAPGAKLDEEAIARLYRFADGGWQPSELASHFAVTRQTIWRQLKARNTR